MTGSRATPAVRLARRLERTPNGCLEWTGPLNEKGYGKITVDGKQIAVHRLAWMLAKGPIPPGATIRHKCLNPPCCDDTHLYLIPKSRLPG